MAIPNGNATSADEQHEGGEDEAVAEDLLALPPLAQSREEAGPVRASPLEDLGTDGHLRRP